MKHESGEFEDLRISISMDAKIWAGLGEQCMYVLWASYIGQ